MNRLSFSCCHCGYLRPRIKICRLLEMLYANRTRLNVQNSIKFCPYQWHIDFILVADSDVTRVLKIHDLVEK